MVHRVITDGALRVAEAKHSRRVVAGWFSVACGVLSQPQLEARSERAAVAVRVVHVTTPATFGGLEQVVRTLVLLQRRVPRIRDVSVVAFQEPDTPPSHLLATLDRAGVPTRALVFPGRSYGAQRQALIDALRELGAEVAHSHGYHADVLLATTRRAYPCATVTTLHGFTGGSWRNRFYEGLQLRALRRFDAVVAVSAPIAARARRSGIPADRVHLIRNAWSAATATLPRADVRRELGIPNDGFQIGWVGRLSGEKGPDLMLEAFARLDFPAARLTMVGTGPEERKLWDRATKLAISDRVTWAGAIPDAGRLLTAFDVVVLSSRTEGTPIVLFEAMSAGTPVVTTAVGGVPDVVSSREAFLVSHVDPSAI